MTIKIAELYSSLRKNCDEWRNGMNASRYKSAVLTFTFPMEIRPFSGMVWLNQIRDPKNDYDLYLELIVKAVEENRKLRNLKLNDLQMLFDEKITLT